MDMQPWLSLAGTALSGLGATVNGISTLYAVTGHHPGGVVSSGIASGAMALFGGWLTSMKLASFAAGGGTGSTAATAVLPVLGIGATCAYASIAFFYFLHTIQGMNTGQPPKHAPDGESPDAELYPTPDWMSTKVLNWAVMGRVGVGKSTLINAMRGLKPGDLGSAPVGVRHTTRVPKPYSFIGEVALLTKNMARVWDLPGAGTIDWPFSTYVRDSGLRHFDGVIFVTADSFTEPEMEIMQELCEFRVPLYMVRNKVDQDVRNNAQDHGATAEETMGEIRQEMLSLGCRPESTYLLSAKCPEESDYEFAKLLKAMADDVQTQRLNLPEFRDFLPGQKRMPVARKQAIVTFPFCARETESDNDITSVADSCQSSLVGLD